MFSIHLAVSFVVMCTYKVCATLFLHSRWSPSLPRSFSAPGQRLSVTLSGAWGATTSSAVASISFTTLNDMTLSRLQQISLVFPVGFWNASSGALSCNFLAASGITGAQTSLLSDSVMLVDADFTSVTARSFILTCTGLQLSSIHL